MPQTADIREDKKERKRRKKIRGRENEIATTSTTGMITGVVSESGFRSISGWVGLLAFAGT